MLQRNFTDHPNARNRFGAATGDRTAFRQGLWNAPRREVAKALASTGTAGTDGSKLIGYDLSKWIHLKTLNPKNFMPKLKRMYTYNAKALLTEFNTLTSRGTSLRPYISEGELGAMDAPTVARQNNTIKYLGRTTAVTRVLDNASAPGFGDAYAFALDQSLTHFLLQIENQIWHADTSLNSLAFQGILKQHSNAVSGSDYIVDLATEVADHYTAGGSLNLDTIRSKTHIPLKYGGSFTGLYMSPQARVQLERDEDAYRQYFRTDQNSEFALGMRVGKIVNLFGENDLELIWDIHLDGPEGHYKYTPEDPTDSSKFHSLAPAGFSVLPTLGVTSGGKLPDDDYYYSVSGVSKVGEGPISFTAAAQTTSGSNNTVQITVTHPSDVADILSYRLYRSTTSSSDYTKHRLVKEVAVASAATVGGTQVLTDDGTIIPGSSTAVLMDERKWAIGSLEQPVANELPRTDGTRKCAIDAMMHTELYVPETMVKLTNIGGSVTDPT